MIGVETSVCVRAHLHLKGHRQRTAALPIECVALEDAEHSNPHVCALVYKQIILIMPFEFAARCSMCATTKNHRIQLCGSAYSREQPQNQRALTHRVVYSKYRIITVTDGDEHVLDGSAT